jgi:hypothetical protein
MSTLDGNNKQDRFKIKSAVFDHADLQRKFSEEDMEEEEDTFGGGINPGAGLPYQTPVKEEDVVVSVPGDGTPVTEVRYDGVPSPGYASPQHNPIATTGKKAAVTTTPHASNEPTNLDTTYDDDVGFDYSTGGVASPKFSYSQDGHFTSHTDSHRAQTGGQGTSGDDVGFDYGDSFSRN